MNIRNIIQLFKEAFHGWSEDKASRLGAALAYYAIFSIGPLLLVTIAIVGFVLGKQAAEGQIENTISAQVGPGAASFIQEAIKNASKPGTGILAIVIGLVTLLLAASGIFGQLQDSLNTIWKADTKRGGGIIGMIKDKLLLFLLVLGCGVLLLASLVASSGIAVVGNLIGDGNSFPGGAMLLFIQVLNVGVSLGVLILLFAVLFRFLPDTHVTWKDVWVGAAITAVLFSLGQVVLAFYLSLTNVGSPYGAAGSLVALLVWIYYSALIFFFGAEFTRAYAQRQGSRAQVSAKEKAVRKPAARVRHSPWFA